MYMDYKIQFFVIQGLVQVEIKSHENKIAYIALIYPSLGSIQCYRHALLMMATIGNRLIGLSVIDTGCEKGSVDLSRSRDHYDFLARLCPSMEDILKSLSVDIKVTQIQFVTSRAMRQLYQRN